MIKVQFKNAFENFYAGKHYTYKAYDNAEVGDIVVANTRTGYAIAQVVEVNVTDSEIDIEKIATIEKVIITNKERQEKIRQEKEKKERLERLLQKTKKECLLEYLNGFIVTSDLLEELKQLSTEELEIIVKNIM